MHGPKALPGARIALGLVAAAFVFDAVHSYAGTIDLQIIVQPLEFCENDGSGCVPLTLFEAETNKVFAQAGIDVSFLAPMTFHDSGLRTASSLSQALDRVDFLTTAGDPTILYIGFFEIIPSPAGLGLAFIDGNATAVDGFALAEPPIVEDGPLTFFNYGLPVTLAHLIGHNLGLQHVPLPDLTNLMAAAIPLVLSIDDIYPDGGGFGQLTPEQITAIRSSNVVRSLPVGPPVPEPSTVLLLLGGLSGLVARSKHRRGN